MTSKPKPKTQAGVPTLEAITATLCGPQNRLNQIEPALSKYASQHGLSTDPVVTMDRAGKYGPNPAAHITLWFGTDGTSRADADQAWTDIQSLNLNWVTYESHVTQWTGDGASSIVHRIEWRNDGSGGTTRVDVVP